MLAVETADENLFVPDLEIASLTPVYPNRTRVVLADGTVAHRPGPPPAGPWAKLHDSWVTPSLLVREGEFWKDPAGYLYPYVQLPDLESEDEGIDLPDGLICFEVQDGAYYWRTDSGLLECDLKPHQALELYPQLCHIAQSHLVNLLRVRRFGGREKGGWIELDNGERFEVGHRLAYQVAHALGSQSMSQIDRNQCVVMRRLRDFPYDLVTGDPEQIRRDCPEPQLYTFNLLWQAVLRNLRGEPNDYGRDHASFAQHPLASGGERCGYAIGKTELTEALTRLVQQEGIIGYKQLGFLETEPARRAVGTIRPQILLVAPYKLAEEALPAAKKWGISVLLSKAFQDQLPLENLAPLLTSPLSLLFYSLKVSQQRPILRILEQLEVSLNGGPVQLDSLSDLEQTLQQLPAATISPTPHPFRRIALQAGKGRLMLVDPAEIACWSPTRFGRWRVVLADGQVVHHPGPVPEGPWVQLDAHWVQPRLLKDAKDPAGFQLPDQPILQPQPVPPPPAIEASPSLPFNPEQVLWLDGGYKATWWHLEDGRQIQDQLAGEHAASQHPGLLRFSRTTWIHHNRIRFMELDTVHLDGNAALPLTTTRYSANIRQIMGIPATDRLSADDHGLLQMELRDFPFEIARASAADLRLYFPTAYSLICNVLYQTFDVYERTGVFPYYNTFNGYFYRPLQATLYRHGSLTRAQLRAPWRPFSAKDRLKLVYLRALHAMVYHYKLFTYRQFGFKDAFPEDRVMGTKRRHQILLVEKGDQVEATARGLQENYGLTMLILKGNPSLLATEYFAEELKKHGIYEVEVYFYGDFDYAAWDIGPAFIRQLRFYGIRCVHLARLLLPGCFTREELPLVSRPIKTPSLTIVQRVKRWVQESGGIDGEARGIHANWLFPMERVRRRLDEVLL